jgi:hypothetical protein
MIAKENLGEIYGDYQLILLGLIVIRRELKAINPKIYFLSSLVIFHDTS